MNSPNPTPQPLQMTERFMRLPEVKQLTGMGRTAIYTHIKAGTFPQQYKISRRMVAWKFTEVKAWLDTQQQGGASHE